MFYDISDLKTKEICLQLEKTCEAQPEKKWLPAYYFDICLLDGTKIGKCDLRIGHNEKTYIGGNIGYSIGYMAWFLERIFYHTRGYTDQ
jgi:tagatose 1,6-diphosphate aldolase